MGIGERYGSSLRQVGTSFARSHVQHARLEAVEPLLLHAVALVALVLHLGVGIVRRTQGVGRGNKPKWNTIIIKRTKNIFFVCLFLF